MSDAFATLIIEALPPWPKEPEMPRTQPKFLFELSAREAQELINVIPGGHEPLQRTQQRLLQFLFDAQEIPLTEEEAEEIDGWWKDSDATDLVTWNLPPGQIRREYLSPYNDELESGHRATGPEEGC